MPEERRTKTLSCRENSVWRLVSKAPDRSSDARTGGHPGPPLPSLDGVGLRYSNMLVGGQGITSFAATKIKKVRLSIGGVLRTSSTERDRTRGRSASSSDGVIRRCQSAEAIGRKIVAGLEGSSTPYPRLSLNVRTLQGGRTVEQTLLSRIPTLNSFIEEEPADR